MRRDLLDRLADAAVDLLLGSRCVGCDRPGRLVCATCAATLREPAWPAWPSPTPEGLADPSGSEGGTAPLPPDVSSIGYAG